MNTKGAFSINYLNIEKCIANLFEKYGYQVNVTDFNHSMFDLSIRKKEIYYNVEVKIYSGSNIYIDSLMNFLDNCKSKNCLKNLILLIIGNISEAAKLKLEKMYNIRILDIYIVLAALDPFSDLKSNFISLLPFSVKETEEKDLLLNYSDIFDSENLKKQHTYPLSYIDRLRKIQSGQQHFSEFEKTCTEILKYLFADNLTLWKEQAKSNSKLFRFDLICKIKNETEQEFWNVIKRFYDTLYIVFEFKNYSSPITQSELYTTEKYLYAKALRRVAIMISRKGLDKNAELAQRGVLRENGKLIICLSDADIINMINLKENGDEPCDYLSNYLDELLVDLEK